MNLASRFERRTLTLALVAVIGTLVVSYPAAAQTDPGTGAQAFKNCPADVATIGQTITCTFVVSNTGDTPAEVVSLTETSPFPGGTIVNISCTLADGTAISAGSTLAPN